MSGAEERFDGFTVTELRDAANCVSGLQDDQRPVRRIHRRCFDPSGWLVMAWVGHTLDALDLLDDIADAWEQMKNPPHADSAVPFLALDRLIDEYRRAHSQTDVPGEPVPVTNVPVGPLSAL